MEPHGTSWDVMDPHGPSCAAISQHVRIACLVHVPRRRTALFLAHVCKHRLARVFQLLTVLAGAISLLSMEVVRDCFIFLPSGMALQPARVASFSVAVTRVEKNIQRPEPGVCDCGPCFCGEPSASQGQWSETAQ